jgi:hypothetical protein
MDYEGWTMRKVTQQDAIEAKRISKEGGEPVMVLLGHPLAGKRYVPLLDIEVINGAQYHIVMDSKLRTRLHPSYPVWMLEEGDEIPPMPAPIVTTRPVDQPKATPAKEPKPKKEKTETEKQYSGSKSCICGCGTPTQSTFAPGHDARMKSLLKKVQSGAATLGDVPELVIDYVRTNEKWNGWFGNVLNS